MMIMINMVREKRSANGQQLHNMKQSGELYQWKEEYKKKNLPDYYDISRGQPLHEVFNYICKNLSFY